jgi:CheY-like chemotaxis protein
MIQLGPFYWRALAQPMFCGRRVSVRRITPVGNAGCIAGGVASVAMTDLMATPVIVLSAKDPVNSKQRSLQAGAVAYFQKPPENREFLTEIRNALGEGVALSEFLKT